jgi:hypothetical protein
MAKSNYRRHCDLKPSNTLFESTASLLVFVGEFRNLHTKPKFISCTLSVPSVDKIKQYQCEVS